MVRPTKSTDIKQTEHLKSIKTPKQDIEDRYRTESPLQKKLISVDRLKKTSLNANVSLLQKPLKENIKSSLLSPSPKEEAKNFKLPKMLPHLASDTEPLKLKSVGSKTKFPKLPGSKLHSKTKNTSNEKKKPIMAKSDFTTRIVKVPIMQDQEKTSLPLTDRFIRHETIKDKLTSMSKAASTKKTTRKLTTKAKSKLEEVMLKRDDTSSASFSPRYNGPAVSSVFTKLRKSDGKVLSKKHKTVDRTKKGKPKGEQEDVTKVKSKRKSKLLRSKIIDRILSNDSDPVLSISEIKHNDSFVISARKLQNSTRQRSDSKPDYLKLKRPTTASRINNDKFSLKSCLKKNQAEGNSPSNYLNDYFNRTTTLLSSN